LIGKEENIPCSSSKYRPARILSYLLDGSVLVLPIFLTACFYGQGNIFAGAISFVISIFFASLLPYSFIVFLYKKGVIDDLHMPKRKDRMLPIIVSLSSLIAGYACLELMSSPVMVKNIFILYIFNLTVMGLVTLWWKISFHASYATLFSVIFIYVYGIAALPVLVLVPAVAWARVVMNRHTIAQVAAGTLVTGALSAFLLYSNLYYTSYIRPMVIFDILKLSITGNLDMGMFLTVIFFMLAWRFRKTDMGCQA
jgi:hypothetical protein